MSSLDSLILKMCWGLLNGTISSLVIPQESGKDDMAYPVCPSPHPSPPSSAFPAQCLLPQLAVPGAGALPQLRGCTPGHAPALRGLQKAAVLNYCLLQSHSLAVLLPKHKERFVNTAAATVILKNHTFCLVLGNLWALGRGIYTHALTVC